MIPSTWTSGTELAAAAGVPLSIHGGAYAESGAMARGPAEVAQWPGVDGKIAATFPRRCDLGVNVEKGGGGFPDVPRGKRGGVLARPRRARVVDDSPGPKLLGSRCDALYLAYNGEVRPELAAHLAERVDEARVQGLAVACNLDAWGAVLCVAPSSRCARGIKGVEGWWRLSCDELSLTLETGAAEGWVLEVRPSALMLARLGHEAARACARELAKAILVDVLDERVRRIDLCADWTGYELGSIDKAEWITPRATTADDLAVSHRYSKAGIDTGWGIGKSDVSHRTYDKTRELRKPGQDLKREEEHARWKAAGWSGRDRPYTRAEEKAAAERGETLPPYEPVTRTEFEVRGDALKQFPGLGNLRDPDVLFRSIDALWAYLTDARPTGKRGGPAKSGRPVQVGGQEVEQRAGWCRLVVLGTASRRHRCRTQRRWAAVQRVTFSGVAMPIPARERTNAAAQEKRMVSQCLDLVASEGQHEVHVAPLGKRNLVDLGKARDEIASARDSSAGWSEAEAEAYVRALLEDHRLVSRFKLAARAWPEDEARRRGGWKGAAAYYIERQRAAIAKRSKLHAVLLERAALAKCGTGASCAEVGT